MEWISISEKLPEYSTQIGGIRFINLLLADKDGGVYAGDYTEGKFMVFGVEHPNITHWMPYPNHPKITSQLTGRKKTRRLFEALRNFNALGVLK